MMTQPLAMFPTRLTPSTARITRTTSKHSQLSNFEFSFKKVERPDKTFFKSQQIWQPDSLNSNIRKKIPSWASNPEQAKIIHNLFQNCQEKGLIKIKGITAQKVKSGLAKLDELE